MTDFVREYHNVLSGEACELFCAFFDKVVDGKIVTIHKGEEHNGGANNRVDDAIFLQNVDAARARIISDIVKDCWDKYIEEFSFLRDYPVISHTMKFQRTPPSGGFHAWHWEHSSSVEFRSRMAVWTLYLTDHEDEGETEFLAYGRRVKAEAGKFCIFPADYTAVHRGNPIYTKPKYILTGWYEQYFGGLRS